MLLILIILIITYFSCFLISHIFLSLFLYEEKSELKHIFRDYFSHIFGLSNIMLIMIVLQIADIDHFQ